MLPVRRVNMRKLKENPRAVLRAAKLAMLALACLGAAFGVDTVALAREVEWG